MNSRPPPVRQQLHIGIAACAIDMQMALDGCAQIFPMGSFVPNDGRDLDVAAWKMTPEIAARLASACAAKSYDSSFDYEHQKLRAAENGKPAPSAGWFRSLEVRGDGVWATGIEWTPAARQMIESREYRYTSPLFTYDKKTGEVLALVNVALTNTPAIDGMEALAACAVAALTSQSIKEESMDELLERLRWMLNLPVTATAEDISAQLDKLKEMIGDTATAAAGFSLTKHLAALGGELTTTKAALAAASASGVGQPDPARFVPMDQFLTMQSQVAALSQQLEGDKRTELVEAGLADGRILPAAKVYWEQQPIAALSAYLAVAQPIPALVGMQTGGRVPAGAAIAGAAALSADQLQIAKKMGLDPQKFAESLAQRAASA
ncbi:hypothetical protein DF052_26545 [Burkholderia glumae]|uniref:phage protease n=1 Tax=Burkholderia glumae TaxID=337 RepID=UPI000F603D9B|nr:phage protease [Burkholderia glumae]RQZ65525.1 hypothetical protein DF052_26545 [Burkholderia glumae]